MCAFQWLFAADGGKSPGSPQQVKSVACPLRSICSLSLFAVCKRMLTCNCCDEPLSYSNCQQWRLWLLCCSSLPVNIYYGAAEVFVFLQPFLQLLVTVT